METTPSKPTKSLSDYPSPYKKTQIPQSNNSHTYCPKSLFPKDLLSRKWVKGTIRNRGWYIVSQLRAGRSLMINQGKKVRHLSMVAREL